MPVKYDKKLALSRYNQEYEWIKFIKEVVSQNKTPEGELHLINTQLMLERYEDIIKCTEDDLPFIGSYFCSAPELYSAMDLPWHMLLQTPFLAASAPFVTEEIDKAEQLGLGADLCTALRLATYCIEASLTPRPSMIVSLLYPCDGAPMFHQVIDHNPDWKDIPVFAPDPPYFSDERSIDYFADELKRLVEFIQKHSGKTLDWNRFKQVIEESNKQYVLWGEFNELKRAVPTPFGCNFSGGSCFSVSQCFQPGDPRGTEWFRKLVKLAEDKVKKGDGAVPEEKIRYLWFDILPVAFSHEILPWLESEFGAVMAMDMFGNFPYTTIDTSDEREMFRGLAKRNMCDAPMVRQARGVADNFAGDIVRIVKDFSIDVVIWPGHMGHKDGSASQGIMREVCRDLGVQFVHIGMDLFDRRYTTPEEIRDKLAQFFGTIEVKR